MAENLRIFGFRKTNRVNATPLVIILISESKNFLNAWPAGEVMPVASATEESVRTAEFIPHNGEDLWQEGRVAYIDWDGKVHVGTWSDLHPVIRGDVPRVSGHIHRATLEGLLKYNPPDS